MSTFSSYFRTLSYPMFITLGVFIAGHTLDRIIPMRDLASYLLVMQIIAMIWAGRLIVLERRGGVGQAMLASALMVLVVHVTLKLLLMAATALFEPGTLNLAASLRGLFGAFVIFAPFMMFFGYVGGVTARRKLRRASD